MSLIFLLIGFSYGLLAGYYGMGFLPAVIAQAALLVMTMYGWVPSAVISRCPAVWVSGYGCRDDDRFLLEMSP